MSQTEKAFSEKEGLALIAQMIHKAKSSFSANMNWFIAGNILEKEYRIYKKGETMDV